MNVEELRARNRFDIDLRSGLRVTLELPNMLDCMIAVAIPMKVIQHFQALADASASNGKDPKDSVAGLELEEVGHIRRANVERIRRAVKALDGEPLAQPLTTEDVESGFSESEQEDILSYLDRERTDPKAEAQPSAISPDSPLPQTG